MTDMLQDIADFHEKFGLAYLEGPRPLPHDLWKFRTKFMTEELLEYLTAENMEQELDALVDLVYVALGTAYLQGFDFEEAWCRVHKANMGKVRGSSARSETHDVVKPPGWKPADLSDLV